MIWQYSVNRLDGNLLSKVLHMVKMWTEIPSENTILSPPQTSSPTQGPVL